ncbi:transcriptional repressor LexA [Candidatus Doolittlea endobia]|uniref:LexA repressor n=1 Tax=Candidatus Doolittlea endobia TaxID=1778262 RepID=A0A143WT46_9ENTR|nr:transcriptional repressor LexA [Candidatus Doolittlea endobia]CUX96717.1 LexA repressor [Candidatus Doolittlea endobia]
MKALTARQREVFNLIRDYITQIGIPPTRAEIALRLGFRSHNAAEEHLKALARKGAIEIIPGVSRGIRLMTEEKSNLPLIKCVTTNNSLITRNCQIGPALFEPHADFLLRMSGMSMKDIGIIDGDLLAVHKTQDVRDSQVIVARIDNNITVKRLKRQGHIVKLLPENNEFCPIIVDLRHQELIIEGLAVGVIRNRNWL